MIFDPPTLWNCGQYLWPTLNLKFASLTLYRVNTGCPKTRPKGLLEPIVQDAQDLASHFIDPSDLDQLISFIETEETV